MDLAVSTLAQGLMWSVLAVGVFYLSAFWMCLT